MSENVYGHCEQCGGEVHGDIATVQGTLDAQSSPYGKETWYIQQLSTPDRDWLLCDACNTLLCYTCCSYPPSGYCDRCIQKHKLYGLLIQIGVAVSFCDECRQPLCAKSCQIPESGLCEPCLEAVLDSFHDRRADDG